MKGSFLSNNKDTKDKANGFYYRMVTGIAEYFMLRVPRDRFGLFKPLLLQILKKNDEQIKDLVFTLYIKGLTTRDIITVIKKIYYKTFKNFCKKGFLS